MNVVASRIEAIDLALTEAAARMTGHSIMFDGLIRYLIQLDTFKIFPIVALLCVAASRQATRPTAVRLLLDGIGAGLLALVVTRVVQNFGPARLRPAFLPNFEGPVPFVDLSAADWSSFPSDTAALAVALALVILRFSRSLGILALIWAGLISLARLIGALHYPSDLLVGAVLGALSAAAVLNPLVADLEDRAISRALATVPSLACLVLVVMLFQVGTMFDDVRRGAGGLLRHAGILKEQRPTPSIAAIRAPLPPPGN